MGPLDRYACGVLFPVIQGETGLDAVEDDEAAEEDELAMGALKESEIPAGPARRRRYVPPSAAGFSFFICGPQIRLLVQASATVYELESHRDSGGRFERMEWRREPLVCSESEEDALVLHAPVERTGPANARIPVFGGRAGVDVTWRPFLGGWIATISLFNKTEIEANQSSAAEWNRRCNSEALFEASLRCTIDAGEVGEYPRVDRGLLSDEERELELQYRSRNIFAIGHGCAADWKVTDAGRVTELRTEFVPAVEVPMVTTESAHPDSDIFKLELLAQTGSDEKETEAIVARLSAFINGYGEWVAQRHIEAQDLDDAEAAGRITARMDVALKRMQGGVGLLKTDADVAAAFGLANRSMAWQMRRGRTTTPRWRPFQLAFLLATIESTINEDSPERDLVDLIWFPTGGGKTEAYLGLIALLIVWRRRRYWDKGGGTTAIMRYTLRLLTAQQFERASRLICALELIRRMEPDTGLGDEPITLGMWVGGEASPNKYKGAQEAVAKARSPGLPPPPELVLGECPWCGVPFSPERNFQATSNSFEFICLNKQCEIQQTGGKIPCQVVDEALYEKPPTLLVATIDKFARLAWEPKAGGFFGHGGNRPPELVIQDELHLISGALGSIAGLYEAAIDTLFVLRGVRPKYVASTATIRQASQQIRDLYGRNLAVFPPPGLDCDDSYFASNVPTHKKPGRLYVGYYAPMLDRQHCLAPLAAALLAAPEAAFEPGASEREDLLDAWWTMVVYHGSLRGVGTTHNAFDTDVKTRLRRLADERRQSLKDGLVSQEQGEITRASLRVRQLTSNSGAAENARTFAQLRQKIKEDDCIDAVLATNMISVGLDVERLALMVVNGQPLTTGEYIQATSRVGRGEVPGLVFANYYRDQARSLSHYENFRPYHEAFYRFVEPTSVTPFTWQARARALHAALVIVVRHGVEDMAGKTAASKFRSDFPEIRCAVNALAARCAQACGGKVAELRCHIDELAAKWDDHARLSEANKRQFVYGDDSNLRNADRLLHTHGDKVTGLWETMQSMRNVEQTALLKRL